MAVTMEEQQTWSGDWKVMIVEYSVFWSDRVLTHWKDGNYELNYRDSGYEELTFESFEQALRVAEYLHMKLSKSYLVFPIPCRYSSILDGAFFKAFSQGLGLGMEMNSPG